MKLAFLGIGQVGSALASRFARLGHEVAAAANDANSASVVAARAPGGAGRRLVYRPSTRRTSASRQRSGSRATQSRAFASRPTK